MTITSQWTAASLLLVASVTVPTINLFAAKGPTAAPAQGVRIATVGSHTNTPVFEVKPGRFKLVVDVPGALEAEHSDAYYCRVEGQTTLISILPEGTRLRQGDQVVVLGSAALQDQLIRQMSATERAKWAYENAKLKREVAQIGVLEYKKGIYPSAKSELQNEIKMAEIGVRRGKARLERTLLARQKLNDVLARGGGAKTSGDILAELDIQDRLDSAERSALSAELSLASAQGKLDLLENSTKTKTLKERKDEVQRAQSDELAKDQTWRLEKTKEVKLKREISDCRILARTDGIIQYATDPTRSGAVAIVEGATVRERQVLFRIFDPNSPLLVTVKIPEPQVARIRSGMKVWVLVESFPQEICTGTVTDVALFADRGRSGSTPAERLFTTKTKLDSGSTNLRPGMAARVTIPLAERDNALTLPVSAVLRLAGKDQVAVRKTGGGFAWRDVTLGDWNDTFVEIKQGLKPGEYVALRPVELARDGLKSEEHPDSTGPGRSAR